MTLALDIAVGALAAVALGQQAAFVIDRRHARKTDAGVRKFLAAHAAAAAPEALLTAPEWASALPRPPVSKAGRKAASGGRERVYDPNAKLPPANQHGQFAPRSLAASVPSENSSGGTA